MCLPRWAPIENTDLPGKLLGLIRALTFDSTDRNCQGLILTAKVMIRLHRYTGWFESLLPAWRPIFICKSLFNLLCILKSTDIGFFFIMCWRKLENLEETAGLDETATLLFAKLGFEPRSALITNRDIHLCCPGHSACFQFLKPNC